MAAIHTYIYIIMIIINNNKNNNYKNKNKKIITIYKNIRQYQCVVSFCLC